MERMNPNYPMQRGCWIEKAVDGGGNVVKFTMHDYPYWRISNGDYVGNSIDASVSDNFNAIREFTDYSQLKAFLADEKYVICDRPKTSEERAEIASKNKNFYEDQED